MQIKNKDEITYQGQFGHLFKITTNIEIKNFNSTFF